MNDPRGSVWRKWDLHVHTPVDMDWIGRPDLSSDDKKRAFAKLYINFAKEQELSVIAITDHNFCNRFEDLLIPFIQEESKQHQITILPGFEITASDGSGVHLLAIFPEGTDLHTINDIVGHLFAPGQTRIPTNCNRLNIPCSNKSLTEIKQKIKEANIESIFIFAHADRENGVLDEGTIQGTRRVEEWQREFINICQLSKAPSEFNEDTFIYRVTHGQDDNYKRNITYIIASDCRTIVKPPPNETIEEGRHYLGQKFTWIKADTTFQGLKQIIIEPADRVFIGDEPDILKRVRNNKTKYIHSFAINKEEDAILDEIWFSENPEIVLNPGLISIIGNKGSGKSSIADTLGLLGNTQQSNHFSFLNPTKFRDKRDNKAKHFKAILKWESGDPSEKNLNDDIEISAVETIKCIPQNYLEKICTEQLEGSLFNDELKKVIFSHVSEAEKLNFNKLDDLIEYKTKEKSSSINIAKNEISTLNKEIAALEMKLHPDYKIQVNNKLQIKKQERASHELAKPKEKTKPGRDPAKQKEIDAITDDIYKKVDNIQTFEKEIERIEKERKSDYSKHINSKKLLEKLDNFQKQYDLFKSECKVIAEALSLNVDDIIKLEIKKIDIEKLNTKSWDNYTAKSDILKEDNRDGQFFKKQQLQKEIDALRDKLDQPNKEYQAFLKENAEWEIKLKTIDGDESTPDTIKYYEKQIKEIDTIPEQLRRLKEKRLSNIKEIFDQLCQLRDEYSTLYKPVKDFADSQKFAKERFSMDFRVSIICEGFAEQFFNHITQNKKGSFYGADYGQKRLKDILDSSDFDDSLSLEKFLQQIEENLNTDQRDEFKDTVRYISDQLRQGILVQDFYNYIYSLDYLKPKYILLWASKDLSQLSPGERGTVLLIFYLFISREEGPLVIDQPEENLDNETVYRVLVPCIKEAKKRRQIIIVTHNPNLAVVCDADQIIHCEMKKEKKNKITYTSGAIENPKINKALIDILEGTQPAFDNRDQKYYVERLIYARLNK